MSMITRLGPVLLLGGLSGCVAPPALPAQVPFVAIPGPTKTEAQFHQDDTACRAASVELPREAAPSNAGSAPSQAAALSPVPPGVSYLRCMEVRNNQIEPLAAVSPPVYAYYPAYPVYYRYGYPWAYPVYAFGFGFGYGYGYGFYGGRFGGYGGRYWGGYAGGFRDGGFRDGGYHGGFGGGPHGGGGGGFGHR